MSQQEIQKYWSMTKQSFHTGLIVSHTGGLAELQNLRKSESSDTSISLFSI